MTAATFGQWLNEELLPNENFEPGFPRKTGVETARNWIYEMGYEVLRSKKGVYVDSHESDDVVLYQKTSFPQKVTLGFFISANAPIHDLHWPPGAMLEKTFTFFYNKSKHVSI